MSFRLAEISEKGMALAQKLASGPTLAFARTKELIDQSFENDLATQLEAERVNFVASTYTNDFKEGVQAFVEKRKPEFKGE